MNEASFKSLIKKSVKAQGGFALSLAAPMVNGLPDLYVAMPGFIPILLEAKWMQFGPTRKINITPLQRKTLEHCNNATPYSAFILCGYKIGQTICATICSYEQTHLNKEHSYVFTINNEFSISSLFYNAAICPLYTPPAFLNE